MKRILLVLLLPLAAWGCTKPVPESPVDPPVVDTIKYYEQCLFRPGDYGSTNWRIPAICCLPDGSLLIVCDRRKYNESDLPEDRKHGFGDAALVVCENGDVVCVFVGGNGLFASSESDPINSYVCRSTDGGQTWSTPENITAQLWGSQATNTVCRNYRASFFGSGNGLRLTRGAHAGRIMFAAAMCRKGNSNTLDNFVVFSDDNGHTWQVSDRAYSGGDEAKLMELTDGRVLISVRQSGARGYNHSADGGKTWGTQGRWECMKTNACNGDILRLAATDRGDSRNILLHSIPNSMERRNVSIFVSYDEGDTWQDPVLLFDGPSVYSSMTLLKNGSVGVFLEENPNGACELWYQNWPVDSLLRQ